MAGLFLIVLLVICCAVSIPRQGPQEDDPGRPYREQKILECKAKGGVERLEPRSSIPLGCDLPVLK